MLLLVGGEKGYTFSEPYWVLPEEINFIEVTKDGKLMKININTLSGIYGGLTFFHFTPEDAIEQMLLLIDEMYEEEKNMPNEENFS